MGWMVQSSNSSRDKTFVSSPKDPDQLWGPPNLYSMSTDILAEG
jgi:hypothetical protein